MIKLVPLKTQLNNKDSILKLYNKDSELFVKTIRREGCILFDSEYQNDKGFNRVTYYYHSGYICNCHLINGEIDSYAVDCINYFTYGQIKESLIKLGLTIDSKYL